MSTEQPPNRTRLLAEQAIGEAMVDLTQREEARARLIPDRAKATRARVVRVCVLITVSVAASLVLANQWRPSLFAALLAAQSSPASRQQAEDALRVVVNDVQTFRADYAELPESLAEVGLPVEGQWTYSKKPGERFQLVVILGGHVATFNGP
jgi:hypothetical protein